MGFSHFSLANFTSDLEKGIAQNRHLLLCAPTGSGKSLFFPYFLSKRFSGKIIILEPRRLAAQELAKYFAKCLGEPCGKTVGYKFRMQQCVSENTRIIFQTYGNHLQEILHEEVNADWILFDEFHERKSDMDLLLAYYTQKKEAPRLAIMSAKIEAKPLEIALQTTLLETGVPLYPVQILHQSSASNHLEQDVCQALRTLQRNNIWKTTLVFLPGKSEIRRTHEMVANLFGKNAPELLDLFAGQDEKEQEKIFTEVSYPRIIFTTNIAETSLTVPCVSGVIDSGYERSLEYSNNTGISHLRLSRITLQNAIQRTGRAGRLQEGVCIRLWSEEEEKKLDSRIIPEILKVNYRDILLKKLALAEKLSLPAEELKLLDEPSVFIQDNAKIELEQAGFIFHQKLTSLGKEALLIPLENIKYKEAFLKIRTQNSLLIAMLSLLDSGNEIFNKDKKSHSLESLAIDFLDGSSTTPKEVKLIFDKLSKFAKQNQFKEKDTLKCKEELLALFKDNLGIRNGDSFKLANKQTIRLENEECNAILAFNLLRSGSNSHTELHTSAYLKIPNELLHSKTDTLCYELQWQNSKERFIGIEIRKRNDKEIERKEIQIQECNEEIKKKIASLCSQYWKAKISKENLRQIWETEENKILFQKMKLAAQYFPEYQLPEWNEEDIELIEEEFFDSIFLLKDLTALRYRNILEEYFGKSMLSWLHTTFPDFTILNNGRKAKYNYLDSVVEISARLEDFLSSRGKHFLASGKIPVRYNILAPNFRSVQKTWDLNGFWENTYPEIRKELRGRYPKHPWPEKVL